MFDLYSAGAIAGLLVLLIWVCVELATVSHEKEKLERELKNLQDRQPVPNVPERLDELKLYKAWLNVYGSGDDKYSDYMYDLWREGAQVIQDRIYGKEVGNV